MIEQKELAGSFTLSGKSMTLNRMGYGAMQRAGPGVWGPPKDVNTAIAVLREAAESGVNYIDTSGFLIPSGTDTQCEQHVTRRLLSWFGSSFCRLHGLFEWNLLALRIHPVNVKRSIGCQEDQTRGGSTAGSPVHMMRR